MEKRKSTFNEGSGSKNRKYNQDDEDEYDDGPEDETHSKQDEEDKEAA